MSHDDSASSSPPPADQETTSTQSHDPSSQTDTDDSLLALADRLLAEGDPDQALTDADAGALVRERALDQSAMALQPDQAIGHYRVEELLGQGGMGAVYRGVDELLDRAVAIKALRTAPGSLSTQARSRLLREARSLARLDHSGICRVYDFLEQEDQRYLILEYVDGVTLGRHLESIEVAADRRSRKLQLFEEISRALAVAHEAGIVHRDLKPDNVMVDRAGHARVMDFGIARWEEVLDEERAAAQHGERAKPADMEAAAERPGSRSGTEVTELTRQGSILGTPAFMSPEQLAGEAVRTATDIYSLGLMLGAALNDESVGDAPVSNKERLEQLRNATPETVRGLPSRDLQALVERMLASDPDQRPTATDVADTLRAIRTRPHRRRRTLGLAALIFAALASIGLAASLGWQRLAETRVVADLPRPVMLLLLPVENATGDPAYDWVELGLRTLIEESLVDAAPVRVVDPAQTADLVQALGREDDSAYSRLARESGASIVVSPRLRRLGDRFALDLTTVLPGGRRLDREFSADDPVVATRGLADALIRRIDPAAVIEESHSGDPFVDRLYAMAQSDLARGIDATGANELLERALELEPDFARAHLRRAEGFTQSAEWEAARNEVERAMSLVDPQQERALYLESLDARAGVYSAQGDFDQAEKWLDELRGALGDSAVDRAWRVRLDLRNARLLSQREDSRRLIELTGDLIADLDAKPTAPIDLVLAHRFKGIGHILLKQFDDAYFHLEEALALARDADMDRLEGNILSSIGATLERESKFDEALARYAEAEEIARRVGDVSQLMTLVINRATLLSGQQKFDEAHAMNFRALAFAEELERIDAQALLHYNIAFTSCALGDFVQAREHWEKSATFYDPELWDMLFILGWIQLEEGHPDAAATLARSKERAAHLWAADQEELLQRALLAARTSA